ncbi:sensor histidine kinase [Anaerosporobacter sp.]
MNRKRGKRISITWKVTLWYTAFLCIMALMIVLITYLISDRIIRNSSKEMLINQVADVMDDIEFEDGKLEIDEEDIFIEKGIYIAVYNSNNQLINGFLPKVVDHTLPIMNQELRKISLSEEWYLYDLSQEIPGYGQLTVRGMTLTTNNAGPIHVNIRVLMILAPLIIVIAIVGGYILTKRAFKPVNQMSKTVEQITSGKDLSKRVNLGEGDDELYRLGRTFDQMFERLEDSFEREKQFTSDVSHELRTPVSVILSQCEYARELENCEETKEALDSIYLQTKRISNLISQLLLLARGDLDENKIQLEWVNLSDLLEVIVEDAKEKAKKKNINVHALIEEGIAIKGDETLLMRFFINLIMNAIHYGKESGHIEIALYRENRGTDKEQFAGYVSDDGIGIAEENMEKIFRRFYQVDPSRTVREEGNLGLGLSMVKWIADVHHGEVWVESELGVGSTFFYRFPVE